MKKIQLSDGMPSDIQKTEVSEKVKDLIDATKNELLEIIRKSDLSYDEAFRVLQSVKVELQNKMIKNKLV
ncbi:hypothetical protein ACFC3A_12465 [Enterococcus thailandicus]|uniref:hypothetical protein n=1 Tax=Enterococcus thailandicus TaxID=417368 RepID=UPI0039A565CD